MLKKRSLRKQKVRRIIKNKLRMKESEKSMYKILKAEELAANIYSMVVEAPRVAKRCLPGQFIIN